MGAHDANFHGDLLRKSVFLRIVGDGLSPRPVRRNRCATVANKGNQTSTEGSSTSSRQYSRLPATPPAGSHTSLPGRVDQGTREAEETQYLTSVPGRLPSPKPETPITHLQAGAAKTSTKTSGSSYARKGGLFVNELALQRTTSSHGLPHPSDIDVVPTAHTTESDPIEDGQNASFTNLSKRSNVPAPRNFSSCQTNQSNPMNLTKNTTGGMQNRPRKGRQKGLPADLNTNCDGFIGTELCTRSDSKQAVLRRNSRPGLKKKPFSRKGLVLASGALPVPTGNNDGGTRLR